MFGNTLTHHIKYCGKAYITTLIAPLNDEDRRTVSQFTQSTKDDGFRFINNDAEGFIRILGDRPYPVSMMNMIYHGEIEPLLNDHDPPDWNAIECKVKPFGSAGEEILLRAETVDLYNKQDWKNYERIASEYLNKFGKNISEQERSMFQAAIDSHR